MATKRNPGKYDCYEKAEPDEPMFILLARDPMAPLLVEFWAALKLERSGYMSEKTDEALKCAREMRAWKALRSPPSVIGPSGPVPVPAIMTPEAMRNVR